MEVLVQWPSLSEYPTVRICGGGTAITTWLLDPEERMALAAAFREAADKLDPREGE